MLASPLLYQNDTDTMNLKFMTTYNRRLMCLDRLRVAYTRSAVFDELL